MWRFQAVEVSEKLLILHPDLVGPFEQYSYYRRQADRW
jgi:hypothetical protein